ncbi:MAG: hypothetical protein COT15_01355 [Candidatus Diapherotrites archaeon CG08_land_8_20_14_0_20_34_12]|nr:MAG: hypothetical protein COT15_01355 [Candidatus Diapherotrites archaeon CG08_land_8_20_14_0_20_34_12]
MLNKKKEILPSREECIKLIRENNPENVVKHSLIVNKIAMYLGKKLKKKGKKINLDLLDRASLLHDIDKIESLRNGNHGVIGEKMLKEKGLHKIAKIVRKHVLDQILLGFDSLEEKIVFYADKRVVDDKIVSLDERLKYILNRYGHLNKKLQKRYSEIEKKINKLEKNIFSEIKISKELKELK